MAARDQKCISEISGPKRIEIKLDANVAPGIPRVKEFHVLEIEPGPSKAVSFNYIALLS